MQINTIGTNLPSASAPPPALLEDFSDKVRRDQLIDAMMKIFRDIVDSHPYFRLPISPFPEFDGVKKQIFLNVMAIDQGKSCAFRIKNELYIIAKALKNYVGVIDVIRRTSIILKSSLSDIYVAKDLSTLQESAVIKIAGGKEGKKWPQFVTQSLMNEIDTLHQVNSKGNFKHLQPAPWIVFEYKSKSGKNKFGYLWDRLDGDLITLMNEQRLTLEEKSVDN